MNMTEMTVTNCSLVINVLLMLCHDEMPKRVSNGCGSLKATAELKKVLRHN